MYVLPLYLREQDRQISREKGEEQIMDHQEMINLMLAMSCLIQICIILSQQRQIRTLSQNLLIVLKKLNGE